MQKWSKDEERLLETAYKPKDKITGEATKAPIAKPAFQDIEIEAAPEEAEEWEELLEAVVLLVKTVEIAWVEEAAAEE